MIDRDASNDSVIDLLDRVLDKGIVIDPSVRVSVPGIELLTLESKVVVADIAVELSHVAATDLVSLRMRPIASERRSIASENAGGPSRRADDRPASADNSSPTKSSAS